MTEQAQACRGLEVDMGDTVAGAGGGGRMRVTEKRGRTEGVPSNHRVSVLRPGQSFLLATFWKVNLAVNFLKPVAVF